MLSTGWQRHPRGHQQDWDGCWAQRGWDTAREHLIYNKIKKKKKQTIKPFWDAPSTVSTCSTRYPATALALCPPSPMGTPRDPQVPPHLHQHIPAQGGRRCRRRPSTRGCRKLSRRNNPVAVGFCAGREVQGLFFSVETGLEKGRIGIFRVLYRVRLG